MTIEITRKHIALFVVLTLLQGIGVWFTFVRSPVLAGLPNSVLAWLLAGVPGSALLTTVVIIKLLEVWTEKQR